MKLISTHGSLELLFQDSLLQIAIINFTMSVNFTVLYDGSDLQTMTASLTEMRCVCSTARS